ncbi:MAG: prolyl oligopeptidase family serine peptidase [Alphaproteobacteria bacterium]|nr:prolyl oligopeptidase family serine peptidase [Alphaproteobacteria bacterium]
MSDHVTLEGPSRPPISGGPAKQAVVFLHGYSADGNDLIGLAPYFSESLPDAAFYSPHAPEPGEVGYGRQWFTLQGYDPEMMRRDPARTAGAFAVMYEGAKRSATSLNNYLDSILNDLKLPPERLALIGFSQGTMMALHVGLRRVPTIGGIVGYSGALLGSDHLKEDVQATPPLILVHGSADDVIPVTALSHMQQALDSQDITYTAHIVPNHGHGIEQMGATLGRTFLQQSLLTQTPSDHN